MIVAGGWWVGKTTVVDGGTLGVGAGICGGGDTLGSDGRMEEKSSCRRGAGLGGRMDEKSNDGFGAMGGCVCCLGICLGLSWLKMSASLASAILVSVP